jgi:prepilin peptidase CpaA
MINPEIIKDTVLFVLVAVALVTDLKYHKIYNKWTFPNMLIGVVLCGISPFKPQMFTFLTDKSGQAVFLDGLVFSFEGWLLALILMYAPFHFNIFGGGDVKLLMAVGAIKGPDFALWSFLFTLFFGALLSLGLMIKRGNFSRKMKGAVDEIYLKTFGIRTLSQTEPDGIALYGIAIFAAVAAAWIKFRCK